jgi:hypothetical protein
MLLTEFHTYQDSIRWRLVPAGVEIEGSGVERTQGVPKTVTRVWEAYAAAINRVAQVRGVPCALIIATICTESGGRAEAVRLEPGYVSDELTPHKVSPGLMQTLISTAREAMRMSLDRRWLLQPENSIEAGTAYIARQGRETRFDPPLVAAAYNAGKLVYQPGQQNRWKLRQYPLGSGAHCDRFVRFFNDAVFVLNRHPIRPTVGLEGLLRGQPPVSTPANRETQRASPIAIVFGPKANQTDLTPYSRQVLEDILRAAGLKQATISSTSRTPAEQARVMFDNLERYGVEHQKKLYGRAGDRVIDVYVKTKSAGQTSQQVKAAMAEKIRELGPTNVSEHAADPRVLNVFDVAPSSIKDKVTFERAVKGERRVAKFLTPPADPGYHLEIPQPKSA